MLTFLGDSATSQVLLCAGIELALLIALHSRVSHHSLMYWHVQALLAWPIAVDMIAGALQRPQSSIFVLLVQYGPPMLTAVLLLKRLRGEGRVNPGTLIVAFVPVTAAVFAVLTGQAVWWSLAWLVMASPALIAHHEDHGLTVIVDGFRKSLVLIWGVVLVVAIRWPAETFQPCRLDKCSAIGSFISPGAVDNALGVAIALILPFAVVGLSRFRFMVVAVAGMIMIDYSGSRSALIGAGFGLCAIAVSQIMNRHLRRLALGLISMAAIAASLIPAFQSFPPQTATLRGSLWIRAKDLIGQQPIFGYGPSFWVRQVATDDVVSNYSAHNLWLELLVATGFFGTVLLVVGVGLSLANASPQNRPVLLAVLVGIIACGILEAPVTPYRLSLMPGAFIAWLIATSLRPSAATPPVEGPRANSAVIARSR